MNRKSARRFAAVFCLAILFAPPTMAQMQPQVSGPSTPELLSLESLLNEVRESNPVLRAARLDADALATRPAQVSSLPDPTAGVSYRPLAVTGFDGVLPGQVTVQQMIPYPGKLRLAGEAARLNARMAGYETDELLLELEYQVKESYYELFLLQQHDHHIHSFQSELDDFEAAAAARYEVGAAPQQAILKAQLERAALTRMRLEFAAMRRMHLERIARLVNRPDLAASEDEIVVERTTLQPVSEIEPEKALDSRAEVMAMRTGISMADAEVAMAKKEYLPDFMIGAGIMDMMGPDARVMPVDNLGRRLGIEFGVVIPLQRGRRDAALDEARLRRRAYEARLEAVQTEIETELNDLQNRLREDEKALALYRDMLMPQAETTLASTMSAYTTGQADFLDLLDSRRMLLDLDMEYEETYADYLKTRAQLERTLGVLGDPDVAVR